MHQIDVSEEVYQALREKVRDFHETPDGVLRRMLGLSWTDGIELGKDGKLHVSITQFPCVGQRDEHETQGTGKCIHCGFEDAVCVGQRRDHDGDWYDCDETAEWLGTLHKDREPEPFCHRCIENANRIYPRKISTESDDSTNTGE